MKGIFQKVRYFLDDESGLTTVEYAVAGSLIALAVVTAFTELGIQVGTTIDDINEAIGGAPTGAGG